MEGRGKACLKPCLKGKGEAGLQVLSKTMDSTALTPDKVELATISRDETSGKVRAPVLKRERERERGG